MTDTSPLTKPSPMIRIADLLHRVLKAARRRWYVTLALLLIGLSPVLLTIWKVHKVQKAIAQLKEDNPQVKGWTEAVIRVSPKGQIWNNGDANILFNDVG
ncbi:MAG: hypothetical protein MJH11_18505 [Lentisphaeria bacterium]|nr:hypothetical protein [Lentisphaeria bacterium]